MTAGWAIGLSGTAGIGREPVRAPANDTHIREVRSYVETDPVPQYQHASPQAYEAFRDLKFGIRVHWGVYAIWGTSDASVPLVNYTDEKKQQYQQLYKTWNPRGFDAEKWMQFFDRSGVKIFAFTSKHCDGFSMFDTKARAAQRVNWSAPGGAKLEPCDIGL